MLTEKQKRVVETIEQSFLERLDFYTGTKPPERSPDGWKRARRNIRRRLTRFKNMTENLPHIFEISVQNVQHVEAQRIKTLRETFDQAVRSDFIRYVVQNQEWRENLISMGIKEKYIQKAITFGSFARYGVYDLTVDHIIALRVGGTNKRTNLTILPYYVNYFRDHFEKMQLAIKPDAAEIITFIPRKHPHGIRSLVPLIPDGFRKHTEDEKIVKARVNGLFQMPIF